MTSDRHTLLEKCDELLDFLRDHDEHAKLHGLIADLEELCARLRAVEPADRPADHTLDR